MTDYDLFSAAAARDVGIATAAATVDDNLPEARLVEAITYQLLAQCEDRKTVQFTADDVGDLLDAAGLGRDLAQRRRIVSTVINRGIGRTWYRLGYVQSRRRHCAPIALWSLFTNDEVAR